MGGTQQPAAVGRRNSMGLYFKETAPSMPISELYKAFRLVMQ